MSMKSNAQPERGDRCGRNVWEGKIKGRGTSSRARHCLHIGFAGTPRLRRVRHAARGDCMAGTPDGP